MSITLTPNYSFKMQDLGHPERDTTIAANLMMIDAAIHANVSPLVSAKIIVGSAENVATGVVMSGDITIDNAGVTAIGADKVLDTMLANIARGSIKVGGVGDAPGDLVAKTAAQVLLGDGTDLKSVALTGDISITGAGLTAIEAGKVVKTMVAADVAGDGLVQAVGKELDVNVDDSTLEVDTDVVRIKDLGVTIAKLEAGLKKDITVFGEVDITEATVWKIEFPFKVTINKVNTIVSVALSAHETTVTLKNNSGTSMTNGIITIASEAAKGDVDTASPTEHNVIDVGEDLQLVSSGACTAGKIVATIHYTRTA